MAELGLTICQICGQNLTHNSIPQRQAHYDNHFSAGVDASISQGPQGSRSSRPDKFKEWFTPYNANRGNPETQNIFWHPAQTSPPPRNISPGLIPVLRGALISSYRTQAAWLCHDQAVHINGEAFDRTWGCGYRNFLMACASLMVQPKEPMYFPLLDSPYPPGVRNLQRLIEEAWSAGFDHEGGEQLRRRLVGTGKFIGTGELYVAFTYRGIPCQLVDFELKDGPDLLLAWILEYFSAGPSTSRATVYEPQHGSDSVIITDKMPLILQHDGHSRTVIGCERCVDSTINVLVFDPSRYIPADVRAAGLAQHAWPSATTGGLPAEPGSSGHDITSKVLYEATHPIQTVKAHKRKADEPPRSNTVRNQWSDQNAGMGADSSCFTPDVHKVLGVFRLGLNRLKRNNRYQILYFPVTEPLNEAQRWERRDLTCIKVG